MITQQRAGGEGRAVARACGFHQRQPSPSRRGGTSPLPLFSLSFVPSYAPQSDSCSPQDTGSSFPQCCSKICSMSKPSMLAFGFLHEPCSHCPSQEPPALCPSGGPPTDSGRHRSNWCLRMLCSYHPPALSPPVECHSTRMRVSAFSLPHSTNFESFPPFTEAYPANCRLR